MWKLFNVQINHVRLLRWCDYTETVGVILCVKNEYGIIRRTEFRE